VSSAIWFVDQWPIDVGGVTVCLLFDGDDLMALGEGRQKAAERRVDRGQATMKHGQRSATPVDLEYISSPSTRAKLPLASPPAALGSSVALLIMKLPPREKRRARRAVSAPGSERAGQDSNLRPAA
jgi:hypothetical protein